MTSQTVSLPWTKNDSLQTQIQVWLVPFALIAVLVIVSQFNYLLFHTLAEFFAVIVAMLVSVVAWQMYPFTRNNYLMYLGCGYFWIGLLDLAHALTYKGINIIPAHMVTEDIATQFWVTTRFFEAFLLLTAPLYLQKSLNRSAMFAVFAVGSVVVTVMIAAQLMPTLYVESQGLTPVKIYSEYVIVAIIAVAMVFLWRKKQFIEGKIIHLMMASMLLTGLAELAFTQYISVYGFSNLLGHVFKLLSYWLIFYAVVRTTLHEPFLALARTASTYNAIPDATIVVDSQGIIRQVNDEARRLADLPINKLIGSQCHPIFHPADLSIEDCPVCAHIKQVKALPSLELELGGHNGVCWRDYSLSPVKEKLFSYGMVQVIRDVTQRKEAKAQLTQNLEISRAASRALSVYIEDTEDARRNFEQVLRDVLNVTGSGIGFVGEVHQQADGEPFLKMLAITDISTKDLWGNAFDEITLDESRRFYGQYLSKGMRFHDFTNLFGVVITRGEPLISNSPATHPDSAGVPKGHPMLNAFMGLPLRIGGKTVGMLGIANRPGGYDQHWITKLEPLTQACAGVISAYQNKQLQQQFQQELQNAKDYLEAMYEASPDMIFLQNADGRFLEVNDNALKTYGYTREEMLALPPTAIMQEQFYLLDAITRVKTSQGGELVDIEGTAKRKNGQTFPVEVRLRRLGQMQTANDEKEKAAHKVLAVVTDISRRKAAENELRQHHHNLQELVAQRTNALELSNRELESYSYSIAHDLRAPLRSVTSFSQILKADAGSKLSDQELDYLNRIIGAGKSMAALIDDILELSRISRAELVPKPVNISAIAKTVLEKLAAGQPQRHVHCEVGEDLCAQGDPKLIEVALDNLIGNAWKYTANKPDATIEIGREVLDGEPVFFVKDNGAGFDMEFTANLFKPFHRLHRQDEFEGSGIGLATVQRIVQRHGGHLWAQAVPGEGATFYFTLG